MKINSQESTENPLEPTEIYGGLGTYPEIGEATGIATILINSSWCQPPEPKE